MNDRHELILKNLRENAKAQSTDHYRSNYLASCEAHGGDIAEVAKQVRQELMPNEDLYKVLADVNKEQIEQSFSYVKKVMICHYFDLLCKYKLEFVPEDGPPSHRFKPRSPYRIHLPDAAPKRNRVCFGRSLEEVCYTALEWMVELGLSDVTKEELEVYKKLSRYEKVEANTQSPVGS